MRLLSLYNSVFEGYLRLIAPRGSLETYKIDLKLFQGSEDLYRFPKHPRHHIIIRELYDLTKRDFTVLRLVRVIRGKSVT